MSARPEHAYRVLLHILPRALRAEAEPELLEVFRDEYARARTRGRLAVPRFWTRMVLDLAAASFAERRGPMALFSGEHRMPSFARVMVDLHIAARRLLKIPAWTLGASGTLALGLAASTVAILLVRDVLLRPLDFPRPDRLVRILEVSEGGRCCWYPSFPNAADWRDRARVFSGVGIADIPRIVPVRLDAGAVRVPVSRAARGFFETLGVQPLAGRLFTADENRPGGAPVAIVSERFWRRELRSRPPGQEAVTIGRERYVVVGVLPGGFRFLGDGAAWTAPADIWTPMDRDGNLGSRTSHGFHVVARLRDGVTLEQARSDMNQLAQTLKAEHRQPTQADTLRLTPLQDQVVRSARDPLRLLLYAAGGLLLVAALNLAASVLALGMSRARELSVRLALGATRGTLARLLLVEAMALAAPAAIIGVCLAAVALRAIAAAGAGTLPRLDEARLDAAVAAGAFVLAAITAALAGIVPAIALSRRDLVDRLRTHGATTDAREHRRLWTAFVIGQATLTVALLAGTGLMLRSFVNAVNVDLGYEPREVLAIDVALPEDRYADPARRVAYYDEALLRLRGAAGIEAAGVTNALPHVTSIFTSDTYVQGRPDKAVRAGYRLVDEGYFAAMGIHVLQGDLEAFRAGAAFIDARLAATLQSGAPPLGALLANGFARQPLTVGGLVATVREWNQGNDTTAAIYEDFHRRGDRLQAMHFVARYRGSESSAIRAVRSAMDSVDPLAPVTIESLEARTSEALGDRRLFAGLAAAFGAVALLLSAAGVHAMVAFIVERRRREAAIRMALGARPSDVLRRTAGYGLAPAGIGMAAGAALALPLGRAIQSQLFHVASGDPVSIGAAIAAVGLAAVAASVLPARRAARVDPAEALRPDCAASGRRAARRAGSAAAAVAAAITLATTAPYSAGSRGSTSTRKPRTRPAVQYAITLPAAAPAHASITD